MPLQHNFMQVPDIIDSTAWGYLAMPLQDSMTSMNNIALHGVLFNGLQESMLFLNNIAIAWSYVELACNESMRCLNNHSTCMEFLWLLASKYALLE